MRLSYLFRTGGRSFSIPNLPQWRQTRPGSWAAMSTSGAKGTYVITKIASGFALDFYGVGKLAEPIDEVKTLPEAKKAATAHNGPETTATTERV